jgi:Domain of unknown function (DUF4145)
MSKYVSPKLGESKFTCPVCGVFAQQVWTVNLMFGTHGDFESTPLSQYVCVACQAVSYWSNAEKTQIFPRVTGAPLPHVDMPEEVKRDYMEARLIASDSPRAAAALLRLSVQRLLSELGGKGKNIDDDIAALVAKGLPPQVKDALDICRVVGNNAVHPGEITVQDEPELVGQLFNLINFIVAQTIEREKSIAVMMGLLPTGAKEAIARRDAKAIAAASPAPPSEP